MTLHEYLENVLVDICQAQECANDYTRYLAAEYRDDPMKFNTMIPSARIDDLELDISCKLVPVMGQEGKLNLKRPEFTALLGQVLNTCFRNLVGVLLGEIEAVKADEMTFFSDIEAFRQNLQQEGLKKRIVKRVGESVVGRKEQFLNSQKSSLLDLGVLVKEIARSVLQLFDGTEAGEYITSKELRRRLCSKWEGVLNQTMDTYGSSLLSTVALTNASALTVQDSSSDSGVINSLHFKVNMDSYQWQVSGTDSKAEMILVKI